MNGKTATVVAIVGGAGLLALIGGLAYGWYNAASQRDLALQNYTNLAKQLAQVTSTVSGMIPSSASSSTGADYSSSGGAAGIQASTPDQPAVA